MDLKSATRRTNTEALHATAECLRAGSLAEEIFARHYPQAPRTQAALGFGAVGARPHAEAARAAACVVLAKSRGKEVSEAAVEALRAF